MSYLELFIKRKEPWLPEVDSAVFSASVNVTEQPGTMNQHICVKKTLLNQSGSASGPRTLAAKWKTPDIFVLHCCIEQC